MDSNNRQLAGVTVAFRIPCEHYARAVALAEARGQRMLSPTLRDLVEAGLEVKERQEPRGQEVQHGDH